MCNNLLTVLPWLVAQLAVQLVVWTGSSGNLSVDTYSMGALDRVKPRRAG